MVGRPRKLRRLQQGGKIGAARKTLYVLLRALHRTSKQAGRDEGAAKRDDSATNSPAAITKQKKDLTDLHQFFESFTQTHLEDLMSLLDLAEAPSAPWPRKREDVELLFGTCPGQGAQGHVQAQVNTYTSP